MAFKAGSVYVDAVLNDKGFKKGLKSLGSVVKKGSAAIGAAFVAGMTVSIIAANEFQKSMSNVATVIDTSVISTQDLTKALLQLDPALGSTTDLTNGLYQAFSAGAEDAAEAMQITVDAAMFSKAALTDTATAVDVLTTASNAYGKEVVSSTQAADIFFTTIKEGKITGEELSASIGQSIPLFASTGIALEELSSGMAAMTKQGIASTEATTQLNAIVNSFLKPSKELSAAMDEMGYSSGAAFLEAEGLAGALELIQEKTGGSADEIAELLPNVRAMRGAMALTGEGGDIFTATLEEMENAAGATAEAFEKQEKTFETFRNSLGKTAIIVGNIGKAFVDEIAVGATTANEKLNEFLMSGSAMEIFSEAVGFLAGGFTLIEQYLQPIIDVVLPAFYNIIGTVLDGMDKLIGAQEDGISGFDLFALASQWAASALNIIGVIVSGTIENIFNLVNVIQEYGKIAGSIFDVITGKAKFSDVKDQILEVGSAIKDFVTDGVGNMGDVFATVGSEIVTFADSVETTAIEMESAVILSSNNTRDGIVSNWVTLLTGQKEKDAAALAEQEAAAAAALEAQKKAQEESEKGFSKYWDNLVDGDGTMWDAMISRVQEYMGLVTDIWDGLVGGISETYSMFLQNQIDEETIAYDESVTNLEDKLDQGIITQAEFDQQSETLEQEHGAKMNELAKKQFENEKAMSIANVWINAASAVAGWWASASMLGFPAGPIMAGIMTGASLSMAGIQTGLIAQQQFVPEYAAGGTVNSSGNQIINENGPEMVKLPGGSLVIPTELSQQIANSAGGGASNNIFNFNGNMSFRDRSDIDYLVKEIDKRLGRSMRSA